jgi:hypothetical protein
MGIIPSSMGSYQTRIGNDYGRTKDEQTVKQKKNRKRHRKEIKIVEESKYGYH